MANKRDLTVKKRHIRVVEPDAAAPETTPAKKKKKRRHPRSLLWLILFRLLLVVTLVMLGVLAWRNWDRLAPAALTEWINTLVTGGEGGDGYPVDITGNAVVSMRASGANAAVLTDTTLLMYNSAGAEIVSRSHTFTDPLLDTAGSYVLVTESGGNRYMLGTKKETIRNGQLNNTLRGAAVDSTGQVAFATESSQSYMSEVVVINRAGAELFHWYSADLTVVDVALSPNGKRVAVLGLSAENGQLKSTVLIFLLSGGSSTAESSYSTAGTMLGALYYYNNGNVAAVGDSATLVYDPGQNDAVLTTYDNAQLLGYAFSDRGIGLVTRPYGESSGGELTVLTPAGKTGSVNAFPGEFRHLAAAGDGFYLLTSNILYDADTVGFAKQTTVAADGLQTVEINGKPLILSLTALSRCNWES